MPFDAMVANKPTTLVDYLISLGITPVSMRVLAAHKAEQIRRNPPHPFGTMKGYLWVAGLTAAAMMIGLALQGAFIASMAITAIVLGGNVAILLFMLLAMLGVRLRGRVTWREQYAPSYNDAMLPEPIRSVVKTVRRTKPHDAPLIIGELVRHEVVLDPYIVILWRGQCACLGIWDGKTVIACATMI